MRTVYLDCLSGASGDMILAALIDAGAPERTVTRALTKLPIDAWDVAVMPTMKGPIRAASLEVACDPAQPPRTYRSIVEMLTEAPLDDPVRERALKTFELLARAEATVHGVDITDVHFHEVGSIDAIIDIVGACAALEHFSPDRVVASRIPTGRGFTDSMHGVIPVPAPAVMELLKGAELYERGDRELVTPTGAALLAAWCDSFGDMPQLRIEAVGYGAGRADLEWPNVLRIIVGEEADAPIGPESLRTELIETNIDDMSPELLPYVLERTLDAGALDAWLTPVHMKKGRIGTLLSVLVEVGAEQAVLDVLFRETTSFGVRISPVRREVLDRKIVDVEVEGRTVRVKVGSRGGSAITVSPEFEDCATTARATGIALKEIYERARDAARGRADRA